MRRLIAGTVVTASSRRRGSDAFACAAATVSSAAVGWHASGIRATGLDVPVIYHGDGISAGAFVKSAIEHGSYEANPALGAPFGTSFLDYPMVESTHFMVIRFLGALAPDYATTFNLFFLLGFALSAGAAFVVLRRLGIGAMLAFAGAVLFSCAPYHFLRTGHLFLASYFAIPVYAFVALMALRGRLAGLLDFRSRPFHAAALTALCALCAGTGVYYAFLGSVLIGAAALARAFDARELSGLRSAAIALAAIALTVLANLADTLDYRRLEGPNTAVASRSPAESEIYGLKFVQLLIPSRTHRSAPLAQFGADYSSTAPLVTENSTSSLGALAAIGLIVSLGTLLLRRPAEPDDLLVDCGKLNAVAFAYATIGGLGTVFAWLVTPHIRALNRVSIFIAFFSTLALLWILQRGLASVAKRAQSATAAAAAALLAVGGYDQVPAVDLVAAGGRARDFARDRALVESIAALPSAACVYQMPFIAFPEEAPRFREPYYAQLRPYLHGSGISWSFGAMRGRHGHRWLESLEQIPLEQRLPRLQSAGFGAIYVERAAYPDAGAAVEAELRRLIGPPATISADDSRAVYALASTPDGASLPGTVCGRSGGP